MSSLPLQWPTCMAPPSLTFRSINASRLKARSTSAPRRHPCTRERMPAPETFDGFDEARSIAVAESKDHHVGSRRSGFARRTTPNQSSPDPNDPVLVLQQALPWATGRIDCPFRSPQYPILRRAGDRPVPSNPRAVSNGVKTPKQWKSRTAVQLCDVKRCTRPVLFSIAFARSDWK